MCYIHLYCVVIAFTLSDETTPASLGHANIETLCSAHIIMIHVGTLAEHCCVASGANHSLTHSLYIIWSFTCYEWNIIGWGWLFCCAFVYWTLHYDAHPRHTRGWRSSSSSNIILSVFTYRCVRFRHGMAWVWKIILLNGWMCRDGTVPQRFYPHHTLSEMRARDACCTAESINLFI